MPYIKAADYERAATEPSVPGELNYAVTLKAIDYIRNPELGSADFYKAAWELVRDYLNRVGLSYTNGNAVMGALDCAGREVKRRLMDNPEADPLVANVQKELATLRDFVYDDVLAPYEDEKIAENGDVYPEDIL